MENLTQRWTQSGHPLQNQDTFFFDFQNRAGEASPPIPLVARLRQSLEHKNKLSFLFAQGFFLLCTTEQ